MTDYTRHDDEREDEREDEPTLAPDTLRDLDPGEDHRVVGGAGCSQAKSGCLDT